MNTRTPTPCRTRSIFRSPRPRPTTSSSSATSSRASTASARPTPAFLPPSRRPGKPYPDPPQIPLARPATIALDANFRSAPAVIEGINYIFETVFSAPLGGIAYGPGQRLVVGRPGEYRGLCEISVLDGADAAADAAAIAQRIAEMQRQGFTVRGKDGPRPCAYGDFCILLRGRGDFPLYEEALRAAGVPVFADTAADLLDAPHVRPFAALLRILDNPAQDVELAAVLLSPLYPYTPDDLVRLREQQRGRQPVCGRVARRPGPVRCFSAGPCRVPPPGPYAAGGRTDRRAVRPHRLPGGGRGHAGRCALPRRPAGLRRLGCRRGPPRPGGAGPRDERRAAGGRRAARRGRAEPPRLRFDHDGAPLQGARVPGRLCRQHFAQIQPERRRAPGAVPPQPRRRADAARARAGQPL